MTVAFEDHPEVIAGISQRSDGSMVWGNQLPIEQPVGRRRNAFFIRNGIAPDRVVAGGLAHGTHVAHVKESDVGKYLTDTDGLITNVAGVYLSVTVADCLPVYFYDPVVATVGIAHAGWRGIVAGVLEQTIGELQRSYNSKADNIIVHIGPHIRDCHFEIKEDVAGQLHPTNVRRRGEAMAGDLAGEAMLRLQQLGVQNISVDERCTYCHADEFYSARHDRTIPINAMVAYIGLNT